MRTMLILGAALTMSGATVAQAQTDKPTGDSLWHAARACASEPDRRACWRRVADSWPPAGVASPVNEVVDLPPEVAVIATAGEQFADLVAQTVDALGSGVAPEEALRGLKSLPVLNPTFLPNPLSDMSITFGRLDAYSMVASITRERGWAEAERAVLAAWEADLPADSTMAVGNGATALADDFARLGDHPAVDRVLATLEPENAPDAVTELIRHGRLDAASATAGRMTIAAREAGLRREAEMQLERYRTQVLPMMRAAMARELGPDVLASIPEFDEPALAESLSNEDWRGRARDEVEDARATLLRAADTAGRADIAHPLALALWEQPVDRSLTGANALLSALPILTRPDAPDAAERLTEAERRLRGRDRQMFPLKVFYDGWVSIGRQDQADALLQRWRGFAERQTDTNAIGGDLARILVARDEVAAAGRLPAFNVLMLLQHDREAGIGAGRLEERIAGRDYEAQRTMLSDCSFGGPVYGAFDMAEACIRRRMAFPAITPMEQWSIAQGLVSLGVEHARKGDREKGEILIAEGLAFSPGPPDAFMASDFTVDVALESIVGPPTPEAARAPAR